MGLLKTLGDNLIYKPFVATRQWVDDRIETQAERDEKKKQDDLNALKAQGDLDERLRAITAGEVSINAVTATQQEADAWLMSLDGDFGSMASANQLTMGQRTMARQLDSRFEYDWDVPSESAFVIYNREVDRIAAEEAAKLAHIEDTSHPTDREDDVARPADADENNTGLTADDQRTLYAPVQETAEDYFGTGGADPGEKEPDSSLEGWFDSLFSEPTNDPNDALYNGDPDRSSGEKATIIVGSVVGGAVVGLLLTKAFITDPDYGHGVTMLTISVFTTASVMFAFN